MGLIPSGVPSEAAIRAAGAVQQVLMATHATAAGSCVTLRRSSIWIEHRFAKPKACGSSPHVVTTGGQHPAGRGRPIRSGRHAVRRRKGVVQHCVALAQNRQSTTFRSWRLLGRGQQAMPMRGYSSVDVRAAPSDGAGRRVRVPLPAPVRSRRGARSSCNLVTVEIAGSNPAGIAIAALA